MMIVIFASFVCTDYLTRCLKHSHSLIASMIALRSDIIQEMKIR
jgi:hypothetical protein